MILTVFLLIYMYNYEDILVSENLAGHYGKRSFISANLHNECSFVAVEYSHTKGTNSGQTNASWSC